MGSEMCIRDSVNIAHLKTKPNANHTEHMLLLKYANKKDRIGSRTGSLSCLFLLSRGDVVNGTKLLKQRIKALVDVLLCIP